MSVGRKSPARWTKTPASATHVSIANIAALTGRPTRKPE
jgi:hypothetical protein